MMPSAPLMTGLNTTILNTERNIGYTICLINKIIRKVQFFQIIGSLDFKKITTGVSDIDTT